MESGEIRNLTRFFFYHEDNSLNKVPYEFLSSAFPMFKNFADCVFVNTWTSPVFLKKISKQLDYSIGSDGIISDEVSIYFSSGFYTGISMDMTIEDSFFLGMKLLKEMTIQHPVGIDNILLFKNGNCANKEDHFPENFRSDVTD